jgi:hypothetical protein
MGWFSILLANLQGQAPPVPAVDHQVFGPIRAIYRPKDRPWLWENLFPLRQARGGVRVSWLAGEDGPSEAQIAFWSWLAANIDNLAEQAWPLIAADLDDWSERRRPADPWDELTWTGADLPADGGHASEWSLSFVASRRPAMLLTVTFREGLPAFVTAAAKPARWLPRRHGASAYAAREGRSPARSLRRRTTVRRTSGGYSAGRSDRVAQAVPDPAAPAPYEARRPGR